MRYLCLIFGEGDAGDRVPAGADAAGSDASIDRRDSDRLPGMRERASTDPDPDPHAGIVRGRDGDVGRSAGAISGTGATERGRADPEVTAAVAGTLSLPPATPTPVVVDRLRPVSSAATVRIRRGRIEVDALASPGVVGELLGFAVIDARDLNDAIRIVSRMSPAGDGRIEIRPVDDGS